MNLAEMLNSPMYQFRNIFLAFPQGRQGNRHHIQSIIQIFTEFPLSDHGFEITVSRGNHPKIDMHRLTSHPIKFLFLQDPQKFHLHISRHFANFIQKQRAGVRLFQITQFAFLVRTRKRTRFIAEQFTFKQVGRNCATIDRDKLAASLTGVMDSPGKQFLADAAFSPQHDRDLGGSHFAGHADCRQNQRAMSIDCGEIIALCVNFIDLFPQGSNLMPGLGKFLVQVDQFGNIALCRHRPDNSVPGSDRLSIDQNMCAGTGLMIGFAHQQSLCQRLGNHQVGKKLTDRLADDFSRRNAIKQFSPPVPANHPIICIDHADGFFQHIEQLVPTRRLQKIFCLQLLAKLFQFFH